MVYPLMPRGTAIWLIDNTGLTFEQIANFCGLHLLEIEGIADGDVAQGIKSVDPIANSQLTADEIARCEEDPKAELRLSSEALRLIEEQEKGKKKGNYIPLARRGEKPNAVAWLIKNCPELTDLQISKLIGTTKNTIALIREKKHWNYVNIRPQDPVLLDLCTQEDLNYLTELAKKKMEKEQG